MHTVIPMLLAPAFVSLIVSLVANWNLEARRARRDHITKFFEITREDVKRALEVAIDYFATAPDARTPLQEARVVLMDRELRSALPVIVGPHRELANQARRATGRHFQDLLAELTGGNFQVKDGEVDGEHIRRLTVAGAGLRSNLSRMRDAELKTLAGLWLWRPFGEERLSLFDRYVGASS